MKTRKSRWDCVPRWILVLMFAAIIPMASGCYGRFPLTKLVYKFNGEVSENKWVKSLVMWVFVIIPVYGVATLVDAIIINLIDFWTGGEIAVGSTTTADGTEVAWRPSEDGKVLLITFSKEGQELSRIRFVKVDQTHFQVFDADGQLAGLVEKTRDGRLLLKDAQGVTLETVSIEGLMKLKKAA